MGCKSIKKKKNKTQNHHHHQQQQKKPTKKRSRNKQKNCHRHLAVNITIIHLKESMWIFTFISR